MIVAAAIRQGEKVYALPAPARHHDIIHYLHRIGVGYNHDPDDQGFIDSNHGYVRRAPALAIVRHEEQPLRDGKQKPDHERLLFSEDLW